MSHRKSVLLAFLLAGSCIASSIAGALAIHSGVAPGGQATRLWLEMIEKRLTPEAFTAVAAIQKPLSSDEQAWADLIVSRHVHWQKEIPALAAVFHPVVAPDARIVLGNRGGEDAFTHDAHTIGFDLERLSAIYGDAGLPENPARIDRFFRHEYTHLLQKAWFVDHPLPLDTPLDLALAEIFTEGMGNFHSLSDSWLPHDGQPAMKTRNTLKVLEPRFLARLSAIACASPEQARQLSADLSFGRFDRKWGALTVALWLANEPGTNEKVLREFLLGGTDSVWRLAGRQLQPELRPMLDEIRLARSLCQTRPE